MGPNSCAPTETPTSPNAKQPRDQHPVKDAFTKISTAQDEDKNEILSKELAAAEEAAKHNISQFFEALASRCETEEERQELAKLMRHRQEEEERWRIARTGEDTSSIPFPAPLDPPKSFTLDWWAQQGTGKDRNEDPFPLRHFEPSPADDTHVQVEVPTKPTTLRVDAGLAGEAGWIADTLTRSPSGATGGGRVPWSDPPPREGLTDAEKVFLDKFWTRRGLSDETEGEGDGAGADQASTEEGGKPAWAEAEAGVIAGDVTTPAQEAVLAARAKRGGPLSPQVRSRRVALLAKHFAEREAAKAKAKAKAAEASNPASPPRRKVVPAEAAAATAGGAGAAAPLSPSPAFFQEKLEVSTAEGAAAARAARVAAEAAEVERLAVEGAKLTAFGQAVPSDYQFSSPTAKAKVDALMAKSEQARKEKQSVAAHAMPPPEAPNGDMPVVPPTAP